RADRVEVLAGVAGHVLDLAERLDASETAAHEREGEQSAAQRRVPHRAGGLHLAEHGVAERDRLLDLLETEPELGQPRDRQRARDRAEGGDDVVVGDPVRLRLQRRDLGPAVRVPRPRYAPGTDRADMA